MFPIVVASFLKWNKQEEEEEKKKWKIERYESELWQPRLKEFLYTNCIEIKRNQVREQARIISELCECTSNVWF